jgi:hypothetical protein
VPICVICGLKIGCNDGLPQMTQMNTDKDRRMGEIIGTAMDVQGYLTQGFADKHLC